MKDSFVLIILAFIIGFLMPNIMSNICSVGLIEAKEIKQSILEEERGEFFNQAGKQVVEAVKDVEQVDPLSRSPCATRANRGECDTKTEYMKTNCPDSCADDGQAPWKPAEEAVSKAVGGYENDLINLFKKI